MAKSTIVAIGAASLVTPAFAGIALPAPTMGDNLPGIIIAGILILGYVAFRVIRKRQS